MRLIENFVIIPGSGTVNLNDVLRAVKADPAVWSDMQDLLRRYDDCIRAGDGLHYKRNRGGTGGPSVYVPLSGSQQQPVIMGGSPCKQKKGFSIV